MTERVGQDFDALVVSTAKYGFSSSSPICLSRVSCPSTRYPADEYIYQETVRKIVGSAPGASFR